MQIMTGIRCVDRQPETVARTVASLHQAGFGDLSFFVDGEFDDLGSLRHHGNVSQRIPKVGAWPNFLLGAAELWLRNPNAGAYLMVEDDVVFCRDIRRYLEALGQLPALASLYASTRVEQKIASSSTGFVRLNPGWHVSSGSLAFLFRNEIFERLLTSEFVVGYRKHPPTDVDGRHFRADGLHHVDCVVGRFAYQTGCGIDYHYPSLAQHIGTDSVLYPGFTGKVLNRSSSAFPGEECSALSFL